MRRALAVVVSLFSLVIVSIVLPIGLSQPAGAAQGPPINLGLICSCTGAEASTIAQTAPVLQAWTKWVNAHGGVEGHQINLIVKDDALNPTTSLSEVQTMVNSDHIVALFDNTDVDFAWASFVAAHHVPVLGAVLTELGYSNDDFFPAATTYNHDADVSVFTMKKAGITKVAEPYCAEAVNCLQAVNAALPALNKAHIQLVYKAAISSVAPNYTAPCIAAEQAGANGLAVAEASSIVAKFAEDCATQNYTPVEISGDGSVAKAWLTIPAMNNNVDFEEDYPWFVHDSVTKDFYTALAKYAPGETSDPNFSGIAIIEWTSGVEFQEAAALGGFGAHPTSAAILDGLHKFHDQTLGGLAPPITFTAGKTADNDCTFLMAIKHGKFVTPYGLKAFCNVGGS